jgi:hypothetical protein
MNVFSNFNFWSFLDLTRLGLKDNNHLEKTIQILISNKYFSGCLQESRCKAYESFAQIGGCMLCSEFGGFAPDVDGRNPVSGPKNCQPF